jgi:hypothetical protein
MVLHTPVICSRTSWQLYPEGFHAARRAGDQHLLARLDPPVVTRALQGGLAGHGDYGRLFEGEVRLLGRELALRSARRTRRGRPWRC